MAFYIRFCTGVLDNLQKVVLVDFNMFTEDIDYTKNKVLSSFGIEPEAYVTISQVKEAMIADEKSINLPRNSKEELDSIKVELQQIPQFAECLTLYEALKQV